MKNSTLRLQLLAIAAALIATFASAPLAADEPAASEANQPQAEPAPPESANSSFNLAVSRVLSLATNADSLIGVEVIPVDDVLRSHLGLAEGKGLTVTSVSEGSAAAQAGIQANDVLVAVGEQEIAGAEGLHKSLEASLDKAVLLGYIRGGQRRTVEVTPRSSVAPALRETRVAKAEEPKYWLGVSLANADDTLRSQLGLPAGEGLVVTGIESDSPAAKAGVMVNDLLLKLDEKPLKSIEELTAQLQELADRSVPLELLRRGKPASLTVTPEKRPPDDANLWSAQLALTQSIYLANIHSLENAQWAAALQPSSLAFFASGKEAPPDLAARVNTLLEQAKQLQASLEALQAAIQPPPADPASGSGPKEQEQK